MESLAEIMARVERLALAQAEERQIRPYALQPLSSDEQVTGLVYSFIGHRFGYSNGQEVSQCNHKR